MARRLVSVGHDGAPTKAFSLIRKELELQGWNVLAFLGETDKETNQRLIKTPTSGILEAVDGADFVLIGMSVPVKNAEKEIAAAEHALDLGIPLGVYADTYGAWGRPQAERFCDRTSLLLVVDEEEAGEATEMYPRALRIVSRNHEFESASFPRFSREEIRVKLGIAKDEVLIVIAGHKSVMISALLLIGVHHALHSSLFRGRKIRVIFTPHPGDNVSPYTYTEPVLFRRDDLSVEIMENGKRYVRGYVDDDSLPADERIQLQEEDGGHSIFDLLPGADILVEAASTFCMSAAILGVPVISFFSETSKLRNISVFGQREWKPVLNGTAVEVYGSISALENKLYTLMECSWLFRKIRKRQIELYIPFKERGQFEKTVVQAIQDTVSMNEDPDNVFRAP